MSPEHCNVTVKTLSSLKYTFVMLDVRLNHFLCAVDAPLCEWSPTNVNIPHVFLSRLKT